MIDPAQAVENLPRIVLCTLNARYSHASLGLRYLLANMGELGARTVIREFTLAPRPDEIVEALLADDPVIVGFGVYIWNVTATEAVVRQLRTVRPEIRIVLGGPEVSFETDEQPVCALADHVICGQADLAFAALCRALLGDVDVDVDADIDSGTGTGTVAPRLLRPPPPVPTELASPYAFYTDEDIAHRILYVEASRGCPFKCEFCLSSLDRTAVGFDTERFLEDIDQLIARGARQFKFVDRTFNLNTATSRRILEFFLERIGLGLFLHFELIPDRLPDALKSLLPRFPPGSLQFEIGIQTFNPAVQALISRRQDDARTRENLGWLRAQTHAHIHADLIAGLPGETFESFGAGFDALHALAPHEIQVGILKRLRGTPIARHTLSHGMQYDTSPPYRVLQTGCLDFLDVQRLVRFARFRDLYANAGRFPACCALIDGDSPFRRFLAFSDWLATRIEVAAGISLQRQFALCAEALVTVFAENGERVSTALASDWAHNGLRGQPPRPGGDARAVTLAAGGHARRQSRHRAPVPASAETVIEKVVEQG